MEGKTALAIIAAASSSSYKGTIILTFIIILYNYSVPPVYHITPAPPVQSHFLKIL